MAVVAKPIAGAIDRVIRTNLKGCKGCSKMQDNLNKGMSFADAIYDRFWNKNGKEQTMQYIITKQISVEAKTPEEALAKIDEGTTLSIAINARPEK